MAKRDLEKLQRIVQVADLLYRQRIAEVAEARGRCVELAAAASRVAQFIEAPLGEDARLQEFAVLRAARLQQELRGADRDVEKSLEDAGAALVSAKGAERLLGARQSQARREAAERALNEILEGALRPLGRPSQMR